MKVENSIKENLISTTTEPITDTEEIIKAICEWNGMIYDDFTRVVGRFDKVGTDNNWKPIYIRNETIINPIWVYLLNEYDWKNVVFEKWNDKFFWRVRVRAENNMRYQLWEKVIEIPFKVYAENEDTEEQIIIFPKKSDFIQPRMRSLYVVNTGWAERQRIEKEIMAKIIELAQIRGWNEILSTQNMIEELQTALKKRGIDMKLENGMIMLYFPRRKLRDTAWQDREYINPPIQVCIDFEERRVQCRGYSPHWFGTPSSWWNPCWWNRDNDIHKCIRDCDLKALVNLIVSWAYGYNSADTGTSREWRHPAWKLREYMRWLYDHRDNDEIKGVKEHLEEIKADLEDYDCSTIKDFISSLESENETAE